MRTDQGSNTRAVARITSAAGISIKTVATKKLTSVQSQSGLDERPLRHRLRCPITTNSAQDALQASYACFASARSTYFDFAHYVGSARFELVTGRRTNNAWMSAATSATQARGAAADSGPGTLAIREADGGHRHNGSVNDHQVAPVSPRIEDHQPTVSDRPTD